MKINSNKDYYILDKKTYQFHEYINLNQEHFIQEIHYHTKNEEITKTETFLKQNVNEIAKQHFFSIKKATYQKQDPKKLNLIEIGISNYTAIHISQVHTKEISNLLDNHHKGLIFNLLQKQSKLQEDIKQSIQDNNIDKTFNIYSQLHNIKFPNTNDIYGLRNNIPHITLEFNQLPIEPNPNTYVRKFA